MVVPFMALDKLVLFPPPGSPTNQFVPSTCSEVENPSFYPELQPPFSLNVSVFTVLMNQEDQDEHLWDSWRTELPWKYLLAHALIITTIYGSADRCDYSPILLYSALIIYGY